MSSSYARVNQSSHFFAPASMSRLQLHLVIIHFLKQAFHDCCDMRCERLAKRSASHLCKLHKSAGEQARRLRFTKISPVLHQGEEDGIKGVYRGTCWNSILQWRVEACVQGISMAFLPAVLPVLAIDQFTFVIDGFHPYNGCE